VEHGEDLLVGGTGDGRVSGCRSIGVAGQAQQRLAGDGEFGQFGLGRGELVGERSDLLAEPFDGDAGGGFPVSRSRTCGRVTAGGPGRARTGWRCR
jgi:hypothetical protein